MERKNSIDILRIISAIAVIVIHVISAPVTNSTAEIDTTLRSTLDLIHTLLNWAVPVFFMITGYCVLRKQECSYKYCFSHVIKYICVLFTVGLFYALLEEVFNAKTFSFAIFISSVKNVISGNIWDHMWFVYSIIGIYLVMPVIHAFMQQSAAKIYTFTAVLFLFNILLPAIEAWLPVKAVLPFGGYLFYVCFGGIAAKTNISNKLLYTIAFAALLSVIWIVFGVDTQAFGYNHPAVCLIAMSIFLIISRINVNPRKFALCLSNCTWGIYLIHPFFINIAIKLFKIDVLTSMPHVKLFAFALIVSCVSFVSTYILRKIPLVKKLF